MTQKQVSLSDQIPMTRGQLVTIMEDAFMDGWRKGNWSEWGSPESFLEFYKQEGDSSETTTAIEGLKSGETDVD